MKKQNAQKQIIGKPRVLKVLFDGGFFRIIRYRNEWGVIQTLNVDEWGTPRIIQMRSASGAQRDGLQS